MLKVDQSGQSVIEYILMLFVVITIGLGILSSDRFKNIFGDDSIFIGRLIEKSTYAYKNCSSLPAVNDDTGANLPCYYNVKESTSRFFTPLETYP